MILVIVITTLVLGLSPRIVRGIVALDAMAQRMAKPMFMGLCKQKGTFYD